MAITCTVTGRIHRTRREVTAELARIDATLDTVTSTLADLDHTYTGKAVPQDVGDQWDALHDREHALRSERRDVEDNPRPIPAGEAGTYALIATNTD